MLTKNINFKLLDHNFRQIYLIISMKRNEKFKYCNEFYIASSKKELEYQILKQN